MAAARSIASLKLGCGLVSVPVRLCSGTHSGSCSAVRFNLLAKDESRVEQQYISEKTQKVVPRSEMLKGYEVEKDHFVLFSQEEPKALEDASSHVIEIVAFIPEKPVNPLDYDKAYLLASRGGRPTGRTSGQQGRCLAINVRVAAAVVFARPELTTIVAFDLA